MQRKLERFEQSVSRQASEKEAVDRQKASLSRQHEAVQRQLSDLFASKGRYEAERQAHLSRVEERTAIAQELIAKHNFAEFASADGLPEFKIISFINRLKTEHERKLTEARAMKAASKEKEAEIMGSLQKSRSELSALEEKKRMTKSQQVSSYSVCKEVGSLTSLFHFFRTDSLTEFQLRVLKNRECPM